MKNRTAWLLVMLLGVYFGFLFVTFNGDAPFGSLLGQVGITVGIAPNPYNTLDEQLSQEQAQLDQESSSLAEREAAFSSSTEAQSAGPIDDRYLAAGIALVALLLIVNFYWDWRRSRHGDEHI